MYRSVYTCTLLAAVDQGGVYSLPGLYGSAEGTTECVPSSVLHLDRALLYVVAYVGTDAFSYT